MAILTVAYSGLVLLVFQIGSALRCGDHHCHNDERCKLIIDLHKEKLDYHCDKTHGGGGPGHHDHNNEYIMECHGMHDLMNHHDFCYCYSDDCLQRIHTLFANFLHPTSHIVDKTTVMPTTTHTTTTTTTTEPTTKQWCFDRDLKCSDPSYQKYICTSTEPIARKYNVENCALSCNFCSVYQAMLQFRTTTPEAIKASTPKTVCVDRDPVCYDEFYQAVNCTSTDPIVQTFNAENCPKACNLCTEIQTSTPNPICADRDPVCADVFYQVINCTSTDPSIHKFNVENCPKSCGLCTEFDMLHTTPTEPPKTTTTALPCEDVMTKCTDPVYKSLICASTNPDTIAYATKNCPKSCNLCPKNNDPKVVQHGFGK